MVAAQRASRPRTGSRQPRFGGCYPTTIHLGTRAGSCADRARIRPRDHGAAKTTNHADGRSDGDKVSQVLEPFLTRHQAPPGQFQTYREGSTPRRAERAPGMAQRLPSHPGLRTGQQSAATSSLPSVARSRLKASGTRRSGHLIGPERRPRFNSEASRAEILGQRSNEPRGHPIGFGNCSQIPRALPSFARAPLNYLGADSCRKGRGVVPRGELWSSRGLRRARTLVWSGSRSSLEMRSGVSCSPHPAATHIHNPAWPNRTAATMAGPCSQHAGIAGAAPKPVSDPASSLWGLRVAGGPARHRPPNSLAFRAFAGPAVTPRPDEIPFGQLLRPKSAVQCWAEPERW
jgi:hypothetical protein